MKKKLKKKIMDEPQTKKRKLDVGASTSNGASVVNLHIKDTGIIYTFDMNDRLGRGSFRFLLIFLFLFFVFLFYLFIFLLLHDAVKFTKASKKLQEQNPRPKWL